MLRNQDKKVISEAVYTYFATMGKHLAESILHLIAALDFLIWTVRSIVRSFGSLMFFFIEAIRPILFVAKVVAISIWNMLTATDTSKRLGLSASSLFREFAYWVSSLWSGAPSVHVQMGGWGHGKESTDAAR